MTAFNQKKRLLTDAIVVQLRNEFLLLLKEVVAAVKHQSPMASPKSPDRHISRREAALALGVSVQTIAKLLKEGALTFSRIGRRVLVRESDIVALIHSRQSPIKEAV